MSSIKPLNTATLPKVRTDAQKPTLPVIQAAEREAAANNSMDAFKAAKTANEARGTLSEASRINGGKNSVSGAMSPVVRKEAESVWHRPGALNTVAQAGRTAGGFAQGTLKATMAIPMVVEGINEISGRGTAQLLTHSEPTAKDATALGNAAIQNWTDSWVPAPASGAAEFSAKVFDATGEALPGVAISVATGGLPGVLIGTGGSYAYGAANAIGTEMVEGSGDVGKALIAGAIETATEVVGGQTIGKFASKIGNSLASTVVDAVGEGIEEVSGGFVSSLIHGEDYTLAQAVEEFSVGMAVGGLIAGGTSTVNAVGKEIGTAKTVKDVRSGKGDGAIEGLSKSLEVARSNPGKYGEIARSIAEPAIESSFDSSRFRAHVENAVAKSEGSSVRVPSNIDKISARNVGEYHTVTEMGEKVARKGMNRAASVLEAAQVGSGLSPRQSGKILRAVVETNSALYSELGKVSGQSDMQNQTVQIERAADYRDAVPKHGSNDNFSVTDVNGRPADRSSADIGLNAFRGMTSEWVIPTLEGGEFVVPSQTSDVSSSSSSDTTPTALFGSSPGQMLGAGLYLTAMPSKADQYTSGAVNEISMQGSDSTGIMKNSPIFGATTFVNESALNQAEGRKTNDTVRRGRVGDERALADFVNQSVESGNSEAAAIYSKVGNDYTEIVRPDATKTQIERLYLPVNENAANAALPAGAASDPAGSNAAAGHSQAGQNTNTQNPMEPNATRAESVEQEQTPAIWNEEVSRLLNENIRPEINAEVVSTASGEAHDDPLGEVMRDSSAAQENTRTALDEEAAMNDEGSTDNTDTAESSNEGAIEEGLTEMINEASRSEISENTQVDEQSAESTESGERVFESQSTENPSPNEEGASTAVRDSSTINTNVLLDRDDRKKKPTDSSTNLFRGQGAVGQIYETEGYNQAFGVLSSG